MPARRRPSRRTSGTRTPSKSSRSTSSATTGIRARDRSSFFAKLLAAHGLPAPVLEHQFAREALGRKWAFDYAWPDAQVALEVEGGVYTRGRHVRPLGFLKDIEKYNAAARLGWRVVRCTPASLCTPETLDLVRDVLRCAAS